MACCSHRYLVSLQRGKSLAPVERHANVPTCCLFIATNLTLALIRGYTFITHCKFTCQLPPQGWKSMSAGVLSIKKTNKKKDTESALTGASARFQHAGGLVCRSPIVNVILALLVYHVKNNRLESDWLTRIYRNSPKVFCYTAVLQQITPITLVFHAISIRHNLVCFDFQLPLKHHLLARWHVYHCKSQEKGKRKTV